MCSLLFEKYKFHKENDKMTADYRRSNNHFEFYNTNPKGYIREGDCITRAIAAVVDEPWENILSEQWKFALQTSRAFGSATVKELIMQKHKYIKVAEPKKTNGSKYSVIDFCKWLSHMGYRKPVLVKVNHHMTALRIKDGVYKIHDTWDCGNMIVRGYYLSADEFHH